ncbi:trypsin-like serine protease [Vibrio sp. AND4]|uniref:trypsin-like serine protease n=1 Tax=Vibrio sp. AND4 TaxID=314289 RepID=UPI00015F0372|nr:trypsin-like serine protease [Vibrio sp. AND4]EDP57999.1 hypothetical protein AND4_00085 [Vibrio sp. AND4]
MKKRIILLSLLSIPLSPAYAVVNGENAQPDEFPWLVKITHAPRTIESPPIQNSCSGTLISNNKILTAAHCLVGKQNSLADFEITFPNASNQNDVFTVSAVYVHPSYNAASTKVFETTGIDEDGEEYQTYDIQSYVTHDIGLIQLTSEVEGITPIDISSYNKDSLAFYGAGYGVRGDITTQEEGNTLAKVAFDIIDVDECKQHASAANSAITSVDKRSIGVSPLASSVNSYCTIGTKPFSSVCKGDSGSPLIQINDGKPSVLGVLTSGASIACAHESSHQNTPNLYTSANQYRYFVNSILSGDTNLKKHKNLIENPFNDKVNGEGWTFNEISNFYLSDQEYSRWSFLHKYTITLAIQQFLPGGPLAENVPEEIQNLINKYPYGNLIQADIKEIPKVPSFFATSYLPAKRYQDIDLSAKTELSIKELAKLKPNIIVSELFTRTYCGGDRYFMSATLLDENKEIIKKVSTGNKYLDGSCNWNLDWQEARFEIPYIEGTKYIRFEDGGQDSENWEGYYGPRMTGASIRLNVPSENG